jgi:hypothetical protein
MLARPSPAIKPPRPGDARKAAAELLRRGRVPVPIPPGSKAPTLKGWQTLTRDGYRLDDHFPAGEALNVGVLNGRPSGGLVDVDLDCREALEAAPALMPETHMLSGRKSAPASHRWYVVTDPPDKASEQFNDPLRGSGKGARLLELRSTGGQTVVPHSVYPADEDHPQPEPCVWQDHGDPAPVELDTLRKACGRVAAAALLARYWPEGNRHDASLALAGGVLRAGWSVDDAAELVRVVCKVASDPEAKNRVAAVRDTAAKLKADSPATGWPTLAGLLGDGGDAIVNAVCTWLRVGRDRNGHHKPAVVPRDETAAEAPNGCQVILDHFRQRYRPAFKRGNAVVCEDGEVVPMGVACAVPDSELIDRLAGAKNAPRFAGGGVKENALPGFFKTWAKVAWGDLIRGLPDEDAADLGSAAPAREEFRRLVREALLTEFTLQDVIGRLDVRQVERRSLIHWCAKFAKPGPWRSIRSKACWCKLRELPGGELVLLVAVRHGVFAQLGADRRLREMGPKTFAKRAARYGVGRSTRADRPHGQFAVILDPEFVADLTATLPDDDGPDESSS